MVSNKMGLQHTARISLGVLQQMFPGRLVSLRGDIGWPARSPDLSMCDFFLWGYFKDKVFRHRPHTIEDLKQKITEEIEAKPVETCRKSYESFRDRNNNVLMLTAAIFEI